MTAKCTIYKHVIKVVLRQIFRNYTNFPHSKFPNFTLLFCIFPGISQIGVEFPSDFSRKSCKPQACGGRVKQTVSLDEWVASSVSYVVLVVDELNRP